MKVRTRFAPSPTGMLHIGGIRTAMYAYAMAKKNNGDFLLRIEDTDRKRFVESGVDDIYEMLDMYGLTPDESDRHGGDKGPYTQSKRLNVYKKYALELVRSGHAYYCFASKEEIEKQKAGHDQATQFKFNSPYRDMSIDEAEKKVSEGASYVIRQKIPPNREIIFEDALQGTIRFHTNDVDDTVLLKSDGYPTYHLAVVVDDYLMEISHVFRGVEWLPSTPRHLLLYEAFGWKCPSIAHLAIILDPDGGKLSKRKGAVSAREFINQGYLPEAILNFIMLLGWASPEKRAYGKSERELYTLVDFVDLFDMKDLNKSNPVFNREKLVWFNQKYIAALSGDQLVIRFSKWLNEHDGSDENKDDRKILREKIVEYGPDYLESILLLINSRIKTFSEIPNYIWHFYFPPKKIDFKISKDTASLSDVQINGVLQDFVNELKKYPHFVDWSHDKWEAHTRGIAEKLKIKAGQAFMVLRIALLGSPFSPPLYESMGIIGTEKISKRMSSAVS